MNTITTLIPQYGELNRISKDWIVSHTFSFEKQKFIVDFYSEWSDIKAFEQAILELVLHTPPEPCTLLLKSLKKEVREYTRLYEAYSLPHDEVIMRVCNQYADSYKEAIKEEMEVVNRLRKPMNEANNRSVIFTPRFPAGHSVVLFPALSAYTVARGSGVFWRGAQNPRKPAQRRKKALRLSFCRRALGGFCKT